MRLRECGSGGGSALVAVQRQRGLLGAAAPLVRHGDLVARSVLADGGDQTVGTVDRHAVDRRDHVAGLEPGLLARAAGGGLLDLGPGGRDATGGDRVAHRDADTCVGRRLARGELLHDRPRLVDRDREAEADRAALALGGRPARTDGGVDADDVAVQVDQRATGVAGVDRRVGLDRGEDRALATAAGVDRAVQRADDAAGDGALEPERRPDGHDLLADLHVVGAAEAGRRQPAHALGLDQREVGQRVRADDVRRRGGAVVERHQDVTVRLGHHVVVGEDLAVGREDDAGPAAAALCGADVDLDDRREHGRGDLLDALGASGGGVLRGQRVGRADARAGGGGVVVESCVRGRAADAAEHTGEQGTGDDQGAAATRRSGGAAGGRRRGGRPERAVAGGGGRGGSRVLGPDGAPTVRLV